MEIKPKLLKPYTEKQKIDFIVEQNHKNDYEIKETETALEAWGNTNDEKLKQAQQSKLLSQQLPSTLQQCQRLPSH